MSTWSMAALPNSDRTVIASADGKVIGAILRREDAEAIVHASAQVDYLERQLAEAQALNLQMMGLLQQSVVEGKRTVGIYRWLRGIKSPPLGWVGDRAKFAVDAILGGKGD